MPHTSGALSQNVKLKQAGKTESSAVDRKKAYLKKWRKKRKEEKPWLPRLEFIRYRCANKKAKNYYRYGGRGIKCFLSDEDLKVMWFRDKAYEMDSPTVDRIDNDGHYIFDNCRFLEKRENSRKRMEEEGRAFTKEQVLEIREKYDQGRTQLSLAKEYGTVEHYIWMLIHKKRWKHI